MTCSRWTGAAFPDVNVITEEFADAFERRAIGFDGAVVIVPHPLQNRALAEIEGFADQFFDEILSHICAVAARPEGRRLTGGSGHAL